MTFTKTEKLLVWNLLAWAIVALLLFCDMPKLHAFYFGLFISGLATVYIAIPFPGRNFKGEFVEGWKRKK